MTHTNAVAAPTTVVISPDMQVGQPGSPGNPLSYGVATGKGDATALDQPGWLGGDPITGHGGDLGAMGGSGAGWSVTSATTEAGYAAPGSSWYASANAQVHDGDIRDGLQQAYNNLSWVENNVDFPTTTSYATVGQSIADLQGSTTVDSGWSTTACIGAAVGVAAAAANLLQPGQNTTANQLAGASAVITAAAACQQFIPSILETPDPSYYPSRRRTWT